MQYVGKIIQGSLGMKIKQLVMSLKDLPTGTTPGTGHAYPYEPPDSTPVLFLFYLSLCFIYVFVISF